MTTNTNLTSGQKEMLTISEKIEKAKLISELDALRNMLKKVRTFCRESSFPNNALIRHSCLSTNNSINDVDSTIVGLIEQISEANDTNN